MRELCVSSDGRLVGALWDDGRLLVWDLDVGGVVRRLSVPGARTLALTSSVVAVGVGNELRMEYVRAERAGPAARLGAEVSALASSWDGSTLWAGCANGGVWAVRAATGRAGAMAALPSAVEAIAALGDSAWAVSDGRVWRLADGVWRPDRQGPTGVDRLMAQGDRTRRPGALWAGGAGGVYRWCAGVWVCHAAEPAWDVAPAGEDARWVGRHQLDHTRVAAGGETLALGGEEVCVVTAGSGGEAKPLPA